MKKSELQKIIKEEISKVLNEVQQPKLEVGQIWFYPYPWNGKNKYYTKIYKIDNKGVSFIESPELTKLTSATGLDATMPVEGFIDLIVRGKAYLAKENQNINEESDPRFNDFSSMFLETYYDMNDHKITFDAATEKLFAWIKANFK